MAVSSSDLLPSAATVDLVSTVDDTSSEAQAQVAKGNRWNQLVADYGWFKAIPRYFFKGKLTEGEDLKEREPKLPWTTNILIYVISFAAVIVSGSVEMISIGEGIKKHDAIEIAIPVAMILTLLLMVLAMDKSLARTIPRVAILAARRDWVVLTECIFYGAAVGGIEIVTLTILILNENRISAILQGTPLVALDSPGFKALAIGRAAITFWTIVHSHLVNEALPIQLSTAKREASEIFGGQFIERVRRLREKKGIRLGRLLETFLLFMQPEPRAPRKGHDMQVWDAKAKQMKTVRYDRAVKQRELLEQHRNELVKALDELESLPDVPVKVTTAGNVVTEVPNPTGNIGGEPPRDTSKQSPVMSTNNAVMGATQVDSVDHLPAEISDQGSSNTNDADHHSQTHTIIPFHPVESRTGGNEGDDHADVMDASLPNTDNGMPGPHWLSNHYELPEDLTLTTRLKQSQVQAYFGVADTTLARRYERDMASLGIQPFMDGTAKNWEVWQILYMFEQGTFNNLPAEEQISGMIRQPAMVG